MRAEIADKHGKCGNCVQHGDSAQTYTENCVSTVYEEIVRKKSAKCLILLRVGTGIEPVYTDFQSIAPPNKNNVLFRRLSRNIARTLSECRDIPISGSG